MSKVLQGPWLEKAYERGLEDSINDLLERYHQLNGVTITGLDAIERQYLAMILNHFRRSIKDKVHPENSYQRLMDIAEKVIRSLGQEIT